MHQCSVMFFGGVMGLNITATSWLHQVRRMELSPPIDSVRDTSGTRVNHQPDKSPTGHVLADNRTLTLPFVSLSETRTFGLESSRQIYARLSTPGTYVHPTILHSEILCKGNPTGRNKRGKHCRTYHHSHICMRAALLGTPPSPTTKSCIDT